MQVQLTPDAPRAPRQHAVAPQLISSAMPADTAAAVARMAEDTRSPGTMSQTWVGAHATDSGPLKRPIPKAMRAPLEPARLPQKPGYGLPARPAGKG